MACETYTNETEVRDVVRQFENCEYALTEFTHVRHVTVACWYLCTSNITALTVGIARGSTEISAALDQMRLGLNRFLAHHGKQGYHETITRFWMELLASYLDELPDMPLLSKVNSAVERYRSKEILFFHYTRERVMSDAAKQGWIAPDLQAIGNAPIALSTTKAQSLGD